MGGMFLGVDLRMDTRRTHDKNCAQNWFTIVCSMVKVNGVDLYKQFKIGKVIFILEGKNENDIHMRLKLQTLWEK